MCQFHIAHSQFSAEKWTVELKTRRKCEYIEKCLESHGPNDIATLIKSFDYTNKNQESLIF